MPERFPDMPSCEPSTNLSRFEAGRKPYSILSSAGMSAVCQSLQWRISTRKLSCDRLHHPARLKNTTARSCRRSRRRSLGRAPNGESTRLINKINRTSAPIVSPFGASERASDQVNPR